jgi:hypothetical protein
VSVRSTLAIILLNIINMTEISYLYILSTNGSKVEDLELFVNLEDGLEALKKYKNNKLWIYHLNRFEKDNITKQYEFKFFSYYYKDGELKYIKTI